MSIGIPLKNRQIDSSTWHICCMRPGERIKAERKAQGLNQVQLAQRAGIKQGTLSEIETGETAFPRGDSLIGICQALALHPAYVTNGTGPKKFDWDFPMQKWLQLSVDHRDRLLDQLEFYLAKQGVTTTVFSAERAQSHSLNESEAQNQPTDAGGVRDRRKHGEATKKSR